MAHISYPRLPVPTVDLRTQLLDRIVRDGIAGLEAGDARRQIVASSGGWKAYRDDIKAKVLSAFGPMPFAREGGDLDARIVSTYDTKHCRIENVLFDSYPGWQVNATLYIPKGSGPFPAIVLPVGHSGKQFENYQVPAQAFASLGFLAVSFDPPGQASEKQVGNDHFRDGARSIPFGITPNRFFVLDALRCIDYLESRKDADVARGVAMSGVSGGGITTLYASLFDDRIVCFGPSCCLNRMADHPVGDAYSGCPESVWFGRLADGIDNIDIALACAPKPMLYMAGRYDEVFHVEASRSLAGLLDGYYSAEVSDSSFAYFEDESGHAYTLEQTSEFAFWTRRWMLGEGEPSKPVLLRDDFEMLDYEMLKCRPSQAVNMFTIHRDLAEEKRTERMARARRSDTADERAAAQTNIEAVREAIGKPVPVADWRESGVFQIWSQGYSEALCTVDSFEVPVSVLRPWRPYRASYSLVFIDDLGRKHALEGGGPAAALTRMIDRDTDLAYPEAYVPDLPGWGDSEPALAPYEIAGWGSMDRLLAYLSYANGDGVLAMQARVAASLTDEISRRSGLPEEKYVIIGTGLGGVVALLASAITETPTSTVMISPLASIEALLRAEFYTWPQAAFLPNALGVFDIPEVAASIRGLSRRVLVLDPVDGAAISLDDEMASRLYRTDDTYPGIDRTDGMAVVRGFLDELAES